jgi:hypothetical protein
MVRAASKVSRHALQVREGQPLLFAANPAHNQAAIPVMSGVIAAQHHGKVIWAVVALVAVLVMHDFVGRKRPAKHRFGYNLMLVPAVVLAPDFRRKHDVASHYGFASLEVGALWANPVTFAHTSIYSHE